MQIRQLFDDDDAVSPVIGVILMVAITVILAAVIATFVLGLGESVSQTTPTASFSSDFNANSTGEAGRLTFNHDGGDTIRASSLFVRGQNGSNGIPFNYNDPWQNFTTNYQEGWAASHSTADPVFGTARSSDNATITGSNSSTVGGESAVSAGDFIRFPVGSDAEIRLIFDGEGDQTSTLARFQGPDA